VRRLLPDQALRFRRDGVAARLPSPISFAIDDRTAQ
jgi:hypothetical protein